MTTRRSVLLPLVVAFSLLSLAACADTTAATETVTPSASPTMTPTAEPVADVSSAPPQILDGECASVLTDAAASDLVGVPVMLVTPRFSDMPQVRSLASLGGLDCWWLPDAADETASLTVTLLPEAAVPGWAEATELTCAPFDSRYNCSSDVIDQGYWTSIYLNAAVDTAEGATGAANTVLSAVDSAVTAAGAPPVAVPGGALDGAWLPRTDCEPLLTEVDAAALTGIPGLTELTFAAGPAEMQQSYAAAVTVTGASACILVEAGYPEAPARALGVDFLPGGSWVEEDIESLPGAVELDPTTVDRAILVSDQNGASSGAVLHVFDGVNWLTVSSSEFDVDSSFLPFAEAIVAAQDAAI